MSSGSRKLARNASLVAAVETRLLSDLVFTKQKNIDNNETNSIAIVGGELFNKGAQAMTFTVVDQMAKRYPEKKIYLLSGRDYGRPHGERTQYEFEILPWGPEIQLSLLSSKSESINTQQYSKRDRETVRTVLRDCSMLIDINGFSLSSQMGMGSSFTYLSNIVIAKKYEIPMYILPQSIGPFDYSFGKQQFLNPLLQTYLPYPQVICSRENAGVQSLGPYTKNNVQREFDIVLQNEEYNFERIYINLPNFEWKELKSNAVGIVPNSKVFQRTDPGKIYSLYETAVEELLEAGRNIYVFRHSTEDLEICRNIKERFSESEEVRLFEEEFNAPELENIIDQCEFLIASRYHSIIHAYKNAVPVIAIGWAVKYQELLQEFGQSEFHFDGRSAIEHQQFCDTLLRMLDRYEEISVSIDQQSSDIRKNNIFDRLFE